MNEQFKNFPIFGSKFWFFTLKKFGKFVNFPTWEIPKMFQFFKFKKMPKT